MGMDRNKFEQFLSDNNFKWTKGADTGKTDKNAEIAQPAKGSYVIVLPNRDKTSTCDWCGEQTQEERHYSRSVGSEVWRAKCKDKSCKKKITIHNDFILNPLTLLDKE